MYMYMYYICIYKLHCNKNIIYRADHHHHPTIHIYIYIYEYEYKYIGTYHKIVRISPASSHHRIYIVTLSINTCKHKQTPTNEL